MPHPLGIHPVGELEAVLERQAERHGAEKAALQQQLAAAQARRADALLVVAEKDAAIARLTASLASALVQAAASAPVVQAVARCGVAGPSGVGLIRRLKEHRVPVGCSAAGVFEHPRQCKGDREEDSGGGGGGGGGGEGNQTRTQSLLLPSRFPRGVQVTGSAGH